MNEILKIFFSLSLSGSIIALALFSLKSFLKDKLSKTWQYYIWLIVIIRLLIPFSVEINIIGQLFLETDKIIAEKSEALDPINDIQTTINNFVPQSQQINHNEFIQQEKVINYWNEIKSNLWLIWIGVAIMLLVRKITSYLSFVRYIKAGMSEVDDNRVLAIFKTTCILARLKKPLPIYTNSLAASAMLVGICKPFVVVPDIEVSEIELHNIFIHELTHYKRLDIFYKWVVQLAVCLHWYNPLVYLVSRDINKNCELSCDEAIIRNLDDKGKRSYGDTLLASLKSNGNYGNTIISITLNEDAKLLKERLCAIMGFRKKSKLAVILSMLLTVLVFSSSTIIGVYAGVDNPTSKIPNYSGSNLGYLTEVPNEVQIENNVPVSQSIKAVNYSKVPAVVNYTKIIYEDTAYKWPYIQHSITNNSDMNIISIEIGCLAFDKDGNPLELYWDARNVAANGEVGSVGFGNGVDYGIVTEIKPYTPKSYYWLYDWDYQEVFPNETKIYDGWSLFDGWWNQPNGIHIANYIISNIKKVVFDDGSVWENSEYDPWLEKYKGKSVSLQTLQAYYSNKASSIAEKEQSTTIPSSYFQMRSDMFLSDAWISNEFQGASNIILEFPKWYTNDMWDVQFIWGDYAVIPMNYDNLDDDNRFMVGVGHDTYYELKIALPNKEILVIDLRELERNLKSKKLTSETYVPAKEQSSGDYGNNYTPEEADKRGIAIIDSSGTWGQEVDLLIPHMTQDGIEKIVSIYLERQLFPGITPPEGARRVAATLETALKHMSEDARKIAESSIFAYYSNKQDQPIDEKPVRTTDVIDYISDRRIIHVIEIDIPRLDPQQHIVLDDAFSLQNGDIITYDISFGDVNNGVIVAFASDKTWKSDDRVYWGIILDSITAKESGRMHFETPIQFSLDEAYLILRNQHPVGSYVVAENVKGTVTISRTK